MNQELRPKEEHLHSQDQGTIYVPVVHRMVELQESDIVAIRLGQHVSEVGVQDDLVHLERLGL